LLYNASFTPRRPLRWPLAGCFSAKKHSNSVPEQALKSEHTLEKARHPPEKAADSRFNRGFSARTLPPCRRMNRARETPRKVYQDGVAAGRTLPEDTSIPASLDCGERGWRAAFAAAYRRSGDPHPTPRRQMDADGHPAATRSRRADSSWEIYT